MRLINELFVVNCLVFLWLYIYNNSVYKSLITTLAHHSTHIINNKNMLNYYINKEISQKSSIYFTISTQFRYLEFDVA